MKSPLSRRQLMGSAAAGIAVSSQHLPASAATAHDKKRALRLAHLTDLHIQPERGAVEGVAAAFHHVQALADKPELIMVGGDIIMDALAVGRDRTALQWELWQKTVRDECSLPVENCLGNHDVFGWDKKASRTTGEEADWGKRWACDVFGRDKSYASFDRNGWHVIMLDSIFPSDTMVYQGRIDDTQWDWLCADLEATNPATPVMVVTHIPILSASVLMGWSAKPKSDGDLAVSQKLLHVDLAKFRDLFWKHRNVKLCLSGHLHLFDRCDYNGVTYLCNGAVSGAWWRGDHQQTKAGYAVIDLYDDGTFDHAYVDYGWKPQA